MSRGVARARGIRAGGSRIEAQEAGEPVPDRPMVTLADARLAFRDLPVVNVASVRPDGGPHVVPLWFVWREESAIYVSCRRGSLTWRNVDRDGRVALSFESGRKWHELHGAVVSGRAEPVAGDHPTVVPVMSLWFDKYRSLLSGPGFARYAEQVEDPGMLRVRPDRIAGWTHAPRPRTGR